MVTCHLIGRAGNQMFQLATAYAHSLRVGANFYRPKKTDAPSIWPLYFPHIPVNPFNQVVQYEYKEIMHSYNPIPTNYKSVRLNGFFQSEKYFLDVPRSKIYTLFDFHGNYEEPKLGCAIHIRLGDYLQFQDQFPVVTLDYIAKSIKYIHENTGIKNFHLFSEDTMRASAMIYEALGLTFNDFNFFLIKRGNAIRDMELMSSYEHQIISNSSYSWWAAWMNPNPKKIITAPKIWFGPSNAHLDTKDVVPEHWVRF